MGDLGHWWVRSIGWSEVERKVTAGGERWHNHLPVQAQLNYMLPPGTRANPGDVSVKCGEIWALTSKGHLLASKSIRCRCRSALLVLSSFSQFCCVTGRRFFFFNKLFPYLLFCKDKPYEPCFCSVVVITITSHARGPWFKTGWKQTFRSLMVSVSH